MPPIRIGLIVLVACVLISPAMLAAQPAEPQAAPVAQAATPGPMQPGMLMAVGRVEIKPGKESAVEKVESSLARLTATKMTGLPRALAMMSFSGPNEAWFLVPLPSYASLDIMMEQFQKMPPAVQAEWAQLNEQEGPYLNSGHMLLCRYLHDFSNMASTDVSAYRYMQVTTYRARQGRADEFLAGGKIYAEAMKKAAPKARWALFEVVSGGPVGTYLLFVPLKKLADLTPDPAQMKSLADALGAEGLQKMKTTSTETMASVSTAVFMFNPSMSSVAPVYATTDPWWAWKSAAPLKTATAPKPAEAVKKSGEPVKK